MHELYDVTNQVYTLNSRVECREKASTSGEQEPGYGGECVFRFHSTKGYSLTSHFLHRPKQYVIKRSKHTFTLKPHKMNLRVQKLKPLQIFSHISFFSFFIIILFYFRLLTQVSVDFSFLSNL